MAIERLTDSVIHENDSEEQKIENTLRPKTFEEYIGQEHVLRKRSNFI